MAIIFDTETTGLQKATIVKLQQQPKIIEFAAIKIDDQTLEEKERLEFLVNPQVPISKFITKLTGITNEKLKQAQPFVNHYETLKNFFVGEKYVVAHNLFFDIQMLKFDLERIGKLDDFPFPKINICTANQTMKLRGFRQNLGGLFEYMFEVPMPKVAHRAMNDVEALTDIFRELIKKQIIKI